MVSVVCSKGTSLIVSVRIPKMGTYDLPGWRFWGLGATLWVLCSA